MSDLGAELISAYHTVLFDLDGTLYYGPREVPGAADLVRQLRHRGVRVRFVTNNAAKSAEDVAGTLRSFGFEVDASDIGTSAQAAARVLRSRLAGGCSVLVVGTDALADEVAAAGLRPVRQAADDVSAVVQGHSPDTGWTDLAEGCVCIRGGALWVACNVDPTLPTARGELPGNGAMVAALRAATACEPTIAGKPASSLFELAAESAEPSTALVIGDRLGTDIAGGVAAGMDTLVVLSGVTTPSSLLAAKPGQRPRYVAHDVSSAGESAWDLCRAPQAGWRISAEADGLLAYTDGSGSSMALLHALCRIGWQAGVMTVQAGDDRAAAALRELRLC